MKAASLTDIKQFPHDIEQMSLHRLILSSAKVDCIFTSFLQIISNICMQYFMGKTAPNKNNEDNCSIISRL